LGAWIRFLFALCDMARFSDASATYGDVPSLLAALMPYGLAQADVDYLSARAVELSSVSA
jgi:hypothetical protein